MDPSGFHNLDGRLRQWSRYWSTVSGAPTREQSLIDHLLQQAINCFFGSKTAERITAAEVPETQFLRAAEPLLTAFLGRRATRELARKVFGEL